MNHKMYNLAGERVGQSVLKKVYLVYQCGSSLILWSAFITYRHETIRIVSVRHARKEERDAYFDDQTDAR